MASPSAQGAKLYFGYGSNLWQHQMSLRCPHSTYLGLARLRGYRWIINERRYANVVEISRGSKTHGTGEGDVVWGLVYELTAEDEARLDVNEGVPDAYTKEIMGVDFWAKGEIDGELLEGDVMIDLHKKPKSRDALVYIDRRRTSGDLAPKEYVHRMNMGIADALKEGVPQAYVDKVLRKWIPEEKAEHERETAVAGMAGGTSVKALAERQAKEFVEEDDG